MGPGEKSGNLNRSRNDREDGLISQTWKKAILNMFMDLKENVNLRGE